MPRRSKMPDRIEPMLCTLVREPPSGRYIFEVKWDGYRIIARCSGDDVTLNSRSGLDYTAKYPRIASAMRSLDVECILDGEVVVFNDKGAHDFDALQRYNGGDRPIVYCVFDLLWLNGQDVTHLPLTDRKELLRLLVKDNETLRFSESYSNGSELYDRMVREGREGIVAKDPQSPYVPGERSKKWLKIPTKKRQEFVIGGWVESDKGRSFRSLLFGAYEDGELRWIGRSGGGYKEAEMPGILKKLKALETEQSPFVNDVTDLQGAVVHWVQPELVANFEFATWTKSGRIRKPATFLGFRIDKKATDVVREVPLETLTEKSAGRGRPANQVPLSPASNWNKIHEENIVSSGSVQVDGNTVELYNVEKELWPQVPKAALIEYYNAVWKYIAPHLKNRPLSLHIKNINAQAPGFYIKDMEGQQPPFVDIFSTPRKHKKLGKRNVIDYSVCNNLATLLYLVNLGCIDINPWNSRTDNPFQPDWIALDLDPSDDDFGKALETARAAKNYLDELELTAFVKTSGKTGIHIFVPCAGFTYPQARSLAEKMCEDIHLLVPAITTTELSIAKRGDRLFVDFSQNDLADTLAAVYTVRPARQPTVSTPLDWKELKAGLEPSDFTIRNMLQRIEKKSDLFVRVHDVSLQKKNSAHLRAHFRDIGS